MWDLSGVAAGQRKSAPTVVLPQKALFTTISIQPERANDFLAVVEFFDHAADSEEQPQ